MSKKVFTASNGIEVSREKYGTVVVRDCLTDTFLVMDDLKYEALREYALHERDEELGLWRDPEDPTKVVYPILGGSNTVYVLNEVTGWSNVWVRTKEPGSYFDPTALRYFEEHPDRGRRPWEHADKGEVWELRWEGKGEPEAMLADGSGRFYTYDGWRIRADDPKFLYGRRIWSEPEASDV